MEILQVNIPDMPNLKVFLGKVANAPDATIVRGGEFLRRNWYWVAIAFIVIGLFVNKYIDSIEREKEANKLDNTPPKSISNQSNY